MVRSQQRFQHDRFPVHHALKGGQQLAGFVTDSNLIAGQFGCIADLASLGNQLAGLGTLENGNAGIDR